MSTEILPRHPTHQDQPSLSRGARKCSTIAYAVTAHFKKQTAIALLTSQIKRKELYTTSRLQIYSDITGASSLNTKYLQDVDTCVVQ